MDALLKTKELYVLKPLNFERFRSSFPENIPLFGSIVAHEGFETDCGVPSSARKLKTLGRLGLFRLVVNGGGRLQAASVSYCKYGAPILSRDHSGEPH